MFYQWVRNEYSILTKTLGLRYHNESDFNKMMGYTQRGHKRLETV